MADPSTIRLAYRAQIRAGGRQVSAGSINHVMNDASSALAGADNGTWLPEICAAIFHASSADTNRAEKLMESKGFTAARAAWRCPSFFETPVITDKFDLCDRSNKIGYFGPAWLSG